jgi:hypothetical protein
MIVYAVYYRGVSGKCGFTTLRNPILKIPIPQC